MGSVTMLAATNAARAGLKRTATQLPAATRLAVRPSSSNAVTPLASDDHSYDYAITPAGDPSKRAFNYAVLGGARFVYASATRLIAMKFIASMAASADVLALASTEVELEAIEMGSSVTVKWRGKPVFVRHRTEDEVDKATKVPMSALKDPQVTVPRTSPVRYFVQGLTLACCDMPTQSFLAAQTTHACSLCPICTTHVRL